MTVAFIDFWDGFNPDANFLLDALRKVCDVEVVNPDAKPDILFYSIFGFQNLYYQDCIRIYYTGENDVPDFNKCDYAISFNRIQFGKRHFCLPFYVLRNSFDMLRSGKRMEIQKRPADRKFASFVVSNNFCSSPERGVFFDKLCKYKWVASGGRFANNIGAPVADKLGFLNKFKFNIAFENSRVDDYITEKVFDALAAGTVPVYWGDPNVNQHLNPNSIINICDFPDLDAAVEYIAMVDSNDSLYNKYLECPPLEGNKYVDWENQLTVFLRQIVTNPRKLVSEFGLGGGIMKDAIEKEEYYCSKAFRKLFNFYKSVRSHGIKS